MPKAAVLWDMDGTLVDSEPLHQQSLESTMINLGLKPPEDLHRQIVGVSSEDVYSKLSQYGDIPLDLIQWLDRKYEIYRELAGNLTVRESGANLFLHFQRTGIKQAVVSNSDRIVVDINLATTNLIQPKLITVSRNDIRQGKPNPEGYLRAAWLLDVDPSQAIVVEDSTTGAKAGVAAGMTTLLWPQDEPMPIPDGAEHIASGEALRHRLLSLLGLLPPQASTNGNTTT